MTFLHLVVFYHIFIEETRTIVPHLLLMSGAKRASKYRKSVTDEYINSFPEPETDEVIARVRGTRGANIFEVELVESSGGAGAQVVELALLPNRFRNVIWVKRNDYLIVKNVTGGNTDDSSSSSAIDGGGSGGVQFEVQHVLSKDQIKHLKSIGKWPEEPTSCEGPKIAEDYSGLGEYDRVSEERDGEEEEVDIKSDSRGNTV